MDSQPVTYYFYPCRFGGLIMELKILYRAIHTPEGDSQTPDIEQTTPVESDTEKMSNEGPYTLTFIDNILTLTFSGITCGHDVVLNTSIELPPEKEVAFEISSKYASTGVTLITREIFTYVDRDTSKVDYKADGDKLARIISDPINNTIWVQLIKECAPIDGFYMEEITGKFSSTQLLSSKVPWLKARIALLNKKASMLNAVDSYKTLAYLEAQVDLLTRIVLAIAPDNELTNMLQKADAVSVLNIKPISDIEAEFAESKATLRALQERYYGKLHE